MAEHTKSVLILGATGQQGGGVVRGLLKHGGWQLNALVRDPEAVAARNLAKQGITLIRGNLDDDHSLKSAFTGMYGVYSVQAASPDSEVEVRRGISVANLAAATGVKHFIYGSVGGADRNSHVPHFESKWRIEQHIRSLNLPASIVRPVFFMDNFRKPAIRAVLLALMSSYVPKAKTLQMISVDDIGVWVAKAFADPEHYIGKAEEIAGDELTRAQIVSAFRKQHLSAGLPFPIPRILLKPLPSDIRKMFEWFGTAGYAADIDGLRERQRHFLEFGEWLSRAV